MRVNKEKLKKYAPEKGIKFIILFGSQATGNVLEESDFDLAVLTTKEKSISTLDNYNDVLDFLKGVLEISDYKIDLTNLNKANPFLRYEVISSGILLYGDEDEYAGYRAFAFKEYIDSRSLFDLEKFLVKKRQRLLRELLVQSK
jgi:predicted nucleotidyltransferase